MMHTSQVPSRNSAVKSMVKPGQPMVPSASGFQDGAPGDSCPSSVAAADRNGASASIALSSLGAAVGVVVTTLPTAGDGGADGPGAAVSLSRSTNSALVLSVNAVAMVTAMAIKMRRFLALCGASGGSSRRVEL